MRVMTGGVEKRDSERKLILHDQWDTPAETKGRQKITPRLGNWVNGGHLSIWEP